MAEADGWAQTEFGEAALLDTRRTARLVTVATTLATDPAASLPAVTGSPAALQATQRFFTNPAIDPAAVVAPHRRATQDRMAAHPVVLAVQDTTELDLSAFPTMEGTGPLRSATQTGLLLHTLLACTPPTADQPALPLGILHPQVWARDPATFGQLPDHHTRPITDKESHKWLAGLAAAPPPTHPGVGAQVVVVGDRESDLYALFVAPRPLGVEVVVRATQPRAVTDPAGTLPAALAQAPVVAEYAVAVRARPGRPARTATVTLHLQSLQVLPPTRRPRDPRGPVTLQAVWVHEPDPPADQDPLDWLLLTTVAVPDAAAARTVTRWYAGRWTIEDWHRVLKSGCAIEARQFATAADFIRCLTVYSVIAWRVLYATRLVRTDPDQPCTAVLARDEWEALSVVHTQASPPDTPPTLGQALTWLAQQGGYQPRRGRPFGPMTLWRGFAWLAGATAVYRAMRSIAAPSTHDSPSTTFL